MAKKGNIKRETFVLITAQENAMRTNYFQEKKMHNRIVNVGYVKMEMKQFITY